MTNDDLSIWKRFLKDVRPLKKKEVVELTPPKKILPDKSPNFDMEKTEASLFNEAPLFKDIVFNGFENQVPYNAPRTSIDPHIYRQIKRNKNSIFNEAKIDLHGMTQEVSYRALVNFVLMCCEEGHQVGLVITGKGSLTRKSVLKESVPKWMQLPFFKARVVSISTADRGHGGRGALYLHFRRKGL